MSSCKQSFSAFLKGRLEVKSAVGKEAVNAVNSLFCSFTFYFRRTSSPWLLLVSCIFWVQFSHQKQLVFAFYTPAFCLTVQITLYVVFQRRKHGIDLRSILFYFRLFKLMAYFCGKNSNLNKIKECSLQAVMPFMYEGVLISP